MSGIFLLDAVLTKQMDESSASKYPPGLLSKTDIS
jgi:hypothetical protein